MGDIMPSLPTSRPIKRAPPSRARHQSTLRNADNTPKTCAVQLTPCVYVAQAGIVLFGAPLLAHYTVERLSKIPSLADVLARCIPVQALATKSMATTVATGIIVAVVIPLVLEMIDEAHRNHASSTAHATRSAAASSPTTRISRALRGARRKYAAPSRRPSISRGGAAADDSELPTPTSSSTRAGRRSQRVRLAEELQHLGMPARPVQRATPSTIPSVTVAARPRASPSSRPSSGARASGARVSAASAAKQGLAAREPEDRRSPGPARMPRRPTMSLRKRARAPSTEAQVSRRRRA